MTNPAAVPQADGAGSGSSVPESLASVGYAMFAWLTVGPLEDVPSFPKFVDAAKQHIAAQQQTPVVQPETRPFGQQPHMGPATPQVPSTPNPVPQPAPQHPAAAPAARDYDPEAAAPAPTLTPDPTATPVPAVPEKSQYRGQPTIHMLNEIAFLDE